MNRDREPNYRSPDYFSQKNEVPFPAREVGMQIQSFSFQSSEKIVAKEPARGEKYDWGDQPTDPARSNGNQNEPRPRRQKSQDQEFQNYREPSSHSEPPKQAPARSQERERPYEWKPPQRADSDERQVWFLFYFAES